MLRKYPRTRHVAGSRLQTGDEDLEILPFAFLKGRHVVIEEKMDGANCAFSFDADANLRLQSRGHFLTGGPRERHFDLLKQWARVHEDAFFDGIGDRYVVYGEWLHALHTIYYDRLPHYFMEFDVLDQENGEFLDTRRRQALLGKLPITPVKVLFNGTLDRAEQLEQLVGSSRFISPLAEQNLRAAAEAAHVDSQRVITAADISGLMEGLYIKVEEQGVVKERLKFVRRDFITRIADASDHWMNRPLISNGLMPGANLF